MAGPKPAETREQNSSSRICTRRRGTPFETWLETHAKCYTPSGLGETSGAGGVNARSRPEPRPGERFWLCLKRETKTADGEGFEPPVGLRPLQFSRLPP